MNMHKSLISAAFAALLLNACTTPGKRTAIGAATGAAVGAGAGAVIGHQSGKKGKGAAIGAAAGGVIGAAIGNRLDKQARELEKIAETRRTDQGLVTILKSSLLFDSGSATLKSAAQASLDEIAAILKKYPEDIITVVGHADSRGPASLNQQLSEKRAQAVRTYLVAQGLPSASLTAVGRGSSEPIASNDSEEGRAKNRRVELNITIDESKVK